MSLVSSLSGVIAWEDRSSDLEARYAKMQELISCISNEASDIGQTIGMLDNKASNEKNSMSLFMMKMQGENNPMQRAFFEKELNRMNMAQQSYQMILLNLNAKKHGLDETEKELMKQKTVLEVQKKFAQATAESLQKMIDPAIQRLVIKG